MGRTLLYALLACGFSGASPAQDAEAGAEAWPPIREIVFAGNDTTQPDVLLREMVVRVGDPADPERIERSRQAIQDLRLFRAVDARQEPVAGGVRVVFKVREKYFLIPTPRADANSDGEYAYGAQLHWHNVLGLNHTLRVVYKRKNAQQAGLGTAEEYDVSYAAPYLFDSAWGAETRVRHVRQPYLDPVAYETLDDTARFVAFRAFHEGRPASQGWRWGGGVEWKGDAVRGAGAPPASGDATALVVIASFTDVRYNLYSEQGQQWDLELQNARDGVASDYDYSSVIGHYDGSVYIGETPHQSIGAFAELGVRHGPGTPFELGGADSLRGYANHLLSGDSYYYAGIEALRPLHWNWLRGVAFIESGNTFAEDGQFTLKDAYLDAGIGLRARFTWFVRLEVNAGVAWPLDHTQGNGARFFATGRR